MAKIYAKINDTLQQVGGSIPAENGWVEMQSQRPTESGTWLAQVDGTWVRIGTELDDAKTSKSTEITSIRDAKEQDYFVYDGSKFDSNRDAAQRINLADNSARNARDAGKAWETEWTLYDNTKRVVTEYDLPRMVDSFSYWSGYCHVYATGLKEAVNAATTIEEANAIDIVNGWPTPEYVADTYENVPLSEKAKRVSLTKREFLKLIIALTEQTSGMTPITLEMIEGYVAQGDSSLRLEWEYATFIERAHPLLDVAANSFGIPSEMLDIMYANSYELLKKLSAGEPISS